MNIPNFSNYLFESSKEDNKKDKKDEKLTDKQQRDEDFYVLNQKIKKAQEYEIKTQNKVSFSYDKPLKPDVSSMGGKARIENLANHVYDAYYRSNYIKYHIKDKVEELKKKRSLSEEETAEFTEMQAEVLVSELLRGDNIELQMVAIAADNTQLAQYAAELAAKAKSTATKDANDKLLLRLDKKIWKTSVEQLNPSEENKQKEDEESSKEDKNKK